MNAFFYHFNFEFRAGIRNKQLLLMNYLFPLGFYLLMGFILAEINPTFREDMIPAMVIFSTLAATLMGIPIALATARENGIFRSYKINGVPAISILTITALTTTFHLLIAAVIVTISAPFLFGASMPVNWLNFVLIFTVTTVNYASISVLIGVVSSSSRVSILWSQLIFVTSILLGGLMFPHHMLPDVAGKISKLLPATHAMNAFNSLAMGKGADFSPWGSVVVLLLGSLLSFVLAVYLFSWDHHHAARRGHPLLGILSLLPFAASIFLLS
ncbi:MAG: ABC transporter permease [Anaerolineales bacterium]|nr:ABC transporter permease [Anaerolineales bacterium]